MKTILSWYGKNTFVRHFLIALGAVSIALSVDPLTKWLVTLPLVSNSGEAVGLVTAVSAWLLRWAQTQVELLVVRLKN